MIKHNKYLMAAAILTAGFAFAAIAPSALAQSQGSGKGNATSSAKDKNATTSLSTSTKGNATSTAAKAKNATSSATSTATSNATTTNGELHRSAVATFVQSLLSNADRLGGIGEQVRVIAREQSSTTKETVDAIKAIETRSSLKTFLAGSDYKNIGVVRSQMANTDSRLERLQAELTKEGDTAAVAAIQAEIQKIKDEQAKLEAFLKANEGKSGLFGWLVRLF